MQRLFGNRRRPGTHSLAGVMPGGAARTFGPKAGARSTLQRTATAGRTEGRKKGGLKIENGKLFSTIFYVPTSIFAFVLTPQVNHEHTASNRTLKMPSVWMTDWKVSCRK